MSNRVYPATAAVLALLLASYVGDKVVTAGGNASPMDTHGGGSVSGMVRLEGPAPKPAHISMGNDPSCAKQHPGGASAEDVVVGSHGALENVIVFVSDGLPAKTFDPPPTPATIEQKGCMYQPHVLALQANQKLRVINEDGTLHNIHPMPQNNREWNKSQPPGMQPVVESFPREEVAIAVKCNVHPWMKSYIAVLNHPSCDTSIMRPTAWPSLVGPARNAAGALLKALRGAHRSFRWMLLVSALAVLGSTSPMIASSADVNRDGKQWIGTWATATTAGPASLQSFRNQSLRLIVHTSAGGTKVRIKISNTFGDHPLFIGGHTLPVGLPGRRLIRPPTEL
jgi:hypothetical protein